MMMREDEPYECKGADEPAYIYGGILADEMGLGKTISVIGLILNNPVPRTLVIGPLAVLNQWADIAAKADISVYKQVGTEWRAISVGENNTVIYLTNYERILVSPTATHAQPWDRLVLDEAHKARNHSSQTFAQIINIVSTTRWALTGTPIVNKMRDLVNLYCLIGSETEKMSSTEALRPLPTLMLARTREMVPEGMPADPKVEHINLEFASEEEAAFYKGIQGNISAKWNKIKDRNDRDAVMMKLLLMLRLRQISVHPQVYIDAQRKKAKGYTVADWDYTCTKFEHIKNMMADFPKDDGTVIFCSFRTEIELFKADLKKEANVFVYYGGMTEDERSANINGAKASLEAGERTVMLVQINSGGTGLNLQFMNRVIFMSPWWTAALMDQAVGRVVRFGQEKKTFVYHVHLKQEDADTIINIDRFMYKKTEEKRVLCQTVLRNANRTV
jgi:transcription termination factor 2